MTTGRLTHSEVMQAIRSGGFGSISLVAAVVLEPNGTLSVIGRDSEGMAAPCRPPQILDCRWPFTSQRYRRSSCSSRSPRCDKRL